jgi:hypothetical protein
MLISSAPAIAALAVALLNRPEAYKGSGSMDEAASFTCR